MLDKYFDFLRQARQAWRHRQAGIAVTLVIAIAGWVLVAQMSDVYRADTRLYVDTASMLNRLLDGVALDSTAVDQEFLRVARSSLLSRPNLERIAREADLDLGIVTPEARERLFAHLASGIIVRANSTQQRGQENLFELAYEHRDPERALTVVRTVHDVFIESVLGLSQRGTERMDSFLTVQIAKYEERLVEAEDRLKQFRQVNASLLPGTGPNYFTTLYAAREALRAAELELTRAERVRANLREQLGPMLSDAAASPSAIVGGVMAPAASAEQARILELQLSQLESRYTDQHPDVVAARRELQRIRSRLGADGPVLQPDGRPDRFRIQDLQLELARAEASVASERVTVDEFRRRMVELSNSVHTIPEVEAELTRLDRDYDVVRRQYEQLVSRREAANMAREADLTVSEGIFQVIDPPHVTTRPIAPARMRLSTMVLGGALAMGGATALLLALVTPTYGDVGQLRDRTGLNVLGRVGSVMSRKRKLEQMRSRVFYGLLLTALLVAYLFILWLYA
ncbi:MAG: hypothetical protein JJT88_19005 [Gammaproteobacteria bacterium]|nr:hypothetical protein [Gammaproteobacteria bacterium]